LLDEERAATDLPDTQEDPISVQGARETALRMSRSRVPGSNWAFAVMPSS